MLLDKIYLPNNSINRIFSNGPLYADSATRITQITDGTSNVFLFLARVLGGPEAGPATYGLTWMGAGVLPTYWDSGAQTPSTWFTFSSNHPGAVNFAFCDGSVCSISKILRHRPDNHSATQSARRHQLAALDHLPVPGRHQRQRDARHVSRGPLANVLSQSSLQ